MAGRPDRPSCARRVAKICKVPAEHIVTMQGTALALFLQAFETCRPGDDAVLATPCLPPSRDCLVGAGVTVREVPMSQRKLGKSLSAPTTRRRLRRTQASRRRHVSSKRAETERLHLYCNH